MKKHKMPRFFRSSASDEDKLAKARQKRDEALANLLYETARLEMYSRLVRKYEESLGLALGGEPEKRKPAKPRSHYLAPFEERTEKKFQTPMDRAMGRD